MSTGKIIQIIGPVINIQFEGHVPPIYTALEVTHKSEKGEANSNSSENLNALGRSGLARSAEGGFREKLTLEVAQHLGSGRVRAVSMGPTEGLERGLAVKDTGAAISVPVGKEILGRMFNLLGEPIDGLGEVSAKTKWPIHRKPPAFTEQSTEAKIFETGIKVIDLIAPFIKGGKVGLFGGAGVGKTVLLQELIRNV